jgi:hypothetical protein
MYSTAIYAPDIHVARPCLVHEFYFSLQLNVCDCLLLQCPKYFSLGAEGARGKKELGPLLLFNPHWANKSIFQQFSKIGINAFKLSPKGNQKISYCGEKNILNFS